MCRRAYLKEADVKPLRVTALVDSGAYMLAINEHVRAQLDLPKLEEQEAELVDGTRVLRTKCVASTRSKTRRGSLWTLLATPRYDTLEQRPS